MIITKDVIEFFDRLAPQWDAEMVKNDEIIEKILDNAGISAGKTVLDVACGTGVMIPYYLKREAAEVTGVDISPKMVEIARSKFSQENVEILCMDAEDTDPDKKYDCIVIYNAFPHFPDPERLIAALSEKLADGGMLTVAHGMSREKIDAHHKGRAHHVSNGLMPADELAAIFAKYLKVCKVISDDRMYQVTGTRK